MIEKIIKIKGVGKFTDYSNRTTPTWDGSLKPLTLIYGENGIGKTTFTSILKSLKEDDTLVFQIRSFEREESPELLIKFKNEPPIKYKNGKWDKNIDDIEIFDTHFVNDNVFTGFEILPQHRKNLYDVVIGNTGVRLKKEIAELKNKIKENNIILKEIENQISKHINIFSVNEILRLQADENIEIKIANKQKEIDASKASEKIRTTPLLKEISEIDYSIRFENLINFCKKSIDTISDEYLKMVEEHKSTLNLGNYSEKWIKDGVDNIVEHKCPFCKQGIEGVEIIKAYNQYFNEQYKNLQSNSKLLKEKVLSLNPENLFARIENDYNYNIGYFAFWKNYIEQDILELNINTFKTQTNELTKNLTEVVNLKADNPIKPVPTETITALEETIVKGNKIIQSYNLSIKKYNEKIASLKLSNNTNFEQLENDLLKLKAIKKRQEENVTILCNKYSTLLNDTENLKTLNTTKQTNLKNYSNEIFGTYRGQINNYLRKFAPYLEIKEMKGSYRGGSTEPFAEFGLYVSGNSIRFQDKGTAPSVKYSLSEGDKSALALSFFLAKVNGDENIGSKIIVFDDPISSFDINRKSATITQLYQIGQKATQLIVLTHNLLFARDFWEKVKNQVQTIKFYSDRNSTQMIDYNIENETLNGLFKDYQTLDLFLHNGAQSDTEMRNIARCIRPILEGYFRIKYYGQFTSNEWLGDFLGKIENVDISSTLHRLKEYYSELNEINDYSKKFHHTNPNSDSEPIYDAELNNYVTRTFEMIAKI
jgi:wobble nucleotide-excising tRNase